jgi:hypothetical protein
VRWSTAQHSSSSENTEKEPEKVQKTLLVITKTLQKAANNSTFAKGQHLACLNSVIASNQEPISHFLQEMSLSDSGTASPLAMKCNATHSLTNLPTYQPLPSSTARRKQA